MMHTDVNTKHSHYHNKDVLMAGVAGVLAGIAGLTAIALTDKDIRKKVGKRAQDLKSTLQDWSTEKLHMVEHHSGSMVGRIEKTADEAKEDETLKNTAIRN